MATQNCRWGILGTANIARKNWEAIFNSGNGTLLAVASRDLARAEQYIRECQADVAFSPAPQACTYEELLGRKDIDAVYIPLPTGIRKEWVIRAARAGKHVLCEKPCAANAKDVAEMLAVCRDQKVQFMDGVMFMHSKRLDLLREKLDDSESIGPLKRIASQFSFLGAEEFMQSNIRVSSDLEPLGALGDLGWYNIRLTLWAMKYELPQRVSGRILTAAKRGDSTSDVPIEFSGEMFFAGGVSANFYCSFITQNQQWACISGAKGYLQVPDFVIPFYGCESEFTLTQPEFQVRGCKFNMKEHSRRYAAHEYSNNAPDSQETGLFRKFGEIVLSRHLEPAWGDISLKTQQVVDACLQSARADGKLVEPSAG